MVKRDYEHALALAPGDDEPHQGTGHGKGPDDKGTGQGKEEPDDKGTGKGTGGGETLDDQGTGKGKGPEDKGTGTKGQGQGPDDKGKGKGPDDKGKKKARGPTIKAKKKARARIKAKDSQNTNTRKETMSKARRCSVAN